MTSSECHVGGDGAEVGHYVADPSTLHRSVHSTEQEVVDITASVRQRDDNYMKIELNKSRDTAMSNDSYNNLARSKPDSSHKEYQGYNHKSSATSVGENAETGENRTA